MSNVLSEEKKQQVIALGRLGWSLRRIEERYTFAGRRRGVSTGCGNPGATARRVGAGAGKTGQRGDHRLWRGVGEKTVPEPQPDHSPLGQRLRAVPRGDRAGLSRGRNAKAIWQDLVDSHGFTGAYQSVKRFVRQAARRRQCRKPAP